MHFKILVLGFESNKLILHVHRGYSGLHIANSQYLVTPAFCPYIWMKCAPRHFPFKRMRRRMSTRMCRRGSRGRARMCTRPSALVPLSSAFDFSRRWFLRCFRIPVRDSRYLFSPFYFQGELNSHSLDLSSADTVDARLFAQNQDRLGQRSEPSFRKAKCDSGRSVTI